MSNKCEENVTLFPVIWMICFENIHSKDNLSNKRWNSMSLMQMPAPNSSAKVIVSIRYASLLFQLCMQPHGYSLLLGGLFKLENTTTLAFYKLKYALPVNVSKLGIGIAGFSGTFSSNIITIIQIWSTLASSSVAINALVISTLAMTSRLLPLDWSL